MIEEYKKFARDFAREAGEIIREGFFKNLDRTVKEDNTLVTEYDTRVNDLLIQRVKEAFPEHAVFGEESKFVGAENAEYVWTCDPIDGTKAFTMSVPLITLMLSLVYKGDPIVGLIYDPILDRIVTAEKGEGALFNDEKVSHPPHTNIKNAYIAYSVNMKYNYVNMFGIWTEFTKHNVHFSYTHIGMAGLLLASGNIDAIVMPFFSHYEFLTLKLILSESGFVMTNLLGQPIIDIQDKKQGLIMAKPELHADILRVIDPITAPLK